MPSQALQAPHAAPALLRAKARAGGAGLILTAALLVACASSSQSGDAAIVSDYQNHQSYVEVTADGTVVSVLSDQAGSSGTHERFIVQLASGGMTVLVEHNVSIGQRVPVADGDHVVVHGEYVWNSQGGLIHFTHRDPQGTHEGGYIRDNGQIYD